MGSKSVRGKTYRVYLNGVCECRGYACSGKCWHVDMMRKIFAMPIPGSQPDQEST